MSLSLSMRFLACVSALFLVWTSGIAQTRSFTQEGIEYSIELPSPAWQVISRLDVHEHAEFVYGNDKAKGYLRVRKNHVTLGTTEEDLFLYDEKRRLQALPGYVACSECTGEPFQGHLLGRLFAYEYTSGGRVLTGRIYYLQVDSRTFYTLHFTGSRESLLSLRSEIEGIARSFRLK